jgi:transketolase
MDSNIGSLRVIRKRILQVAFQAREGHIPSSFSILEILYSFYLRGPKLLQQSDCLVVSKGHAALGLYATLEHFNLIPKDWLDSMCKFNSQLGGHPDMRKIPTLEASTGSLGHGLPFGLGLALGKRIKGEKGTVHVLIGDGELNEGSNWESLLVAKHRKVSNLSLIVDCNESSERALSLGNLREKFESFGWRVTQIDGHSLDDLERFFNQVNSEPSSSPNVLLAKTVKGKGINRMENSPEWHHKIPSQQELEEIILELQ